MNKNDLLNIAKPILFNTEMVRAIMQGRKTVTRRLIKNYKGNLDIKPLMEKQDDIVYMKDYNFHTCWHELKHYIKGFSRYQVGDILYVRETFMEHHTYFIKNNLDNPTILYKVDYLGDENLMNCGIDRWKPSIHMPKKYARIFLEVTDVRVERLQDITEEQTIKEGITKIFDDCSLEEYDNWAKRVHESKKQSDWSYTNYLWHGYIGKTTTSKLSDNWNFQESGYDNAIDSFSSLWNSTLNLKDWKLYGWDSNPYVFVYEFKKVEVNDG